MLNVYLNRDIHFENKFKKSSAAVSLIADCDKYSKVTSLQIFTLRLVIRVQDEVKI